MLASVMTLLGKDWMVSLSCSYSEPAFLGVVSGCVMVKARDSSSKEDGRALHHQQQPYQNLYTQRTRNITALQPSLELSAAAS